MSGRDALQKEAKPGDVFLPRGAPHQIKGRMMICVEGGGSLPVDCARRQKPSESLLPDMKVIHLDTCGTKARRDIHGWERLNAMSHWQDHDVNNSFKMPVFICVFCDQVCRMQRKSKCGIDILGWQSYTR